MGAPARTEHDYLVEGVAAVKKAGIEIAAADTKLVHRLAVYNTIADFHPGVEISVNDLRDALDAAGVPKSSRPGLLQGACRVGLLRPRIVTVRGRRVQLTEPSTGRSAHGSHVSLYVRTAKKWSYPGVAATETTLPVAS